MTETPPSTVVVNLFAGPGTGKSTVAAGAFAHLKMRGRNVEIAHEFAKDLTWEDRQLALGFQPYVAAKQMWRVHRLLGRVEAVITDSPLPLSLVYGNEGGAFNEWVCESFEQWRNLNIVLKRNADREYNPNGRNQTQDEAEALDGRIIDMLCTWGISYIEVPVALDGSTSSDVADLVEAVLDGEELHG